MSAMKTARISLGLAAAVLLATAAFHASGGAMVTGWLSGARGDMLRALWYMPAFDWAVVALGWTYVAIRPSAAAAPLVVISAAMPVGAAALVARAVGPGFPGVWMLAAAGGLAVFGALRLRRGSPAI